MGHQIERQWKVGDCGLTRCSCGRSALKVGKRVFLVSSREVEGLAALFSRAARDLDAGTLADELNRLQGGGWKDFTPQG